MEWWVVGLLLFGIMLLLAFIGVNIPFGLGLTAVIGVFIVWDNPVAGFSIVVIEAYTRGTSWLILAVPMFIILSEAAVASEITADAFDFFSRLLGRVPGGLAVATIALSATFAAITGSSLANAAVVGRASIPEMRRHKYDMGLSSGVVCAGGSLGILIPPSLPMIFFALFSETSVSKLFMAGIVPGLLASLMMTAYVIILVKLKPHLAPVPPQASIREAFVRGWKVIPLLVLILVIFGAFYFGVATATEVGGVGALVALLIGIAYRRLDWEKLKHVCLASVKTTAMIMWILIPALSFGTVLTYAKVPQYLTTWVADLSLSPLMILIVINVFLLILGCFLETGAIMMVVWPMLIAVAQGLGINLVWFCIILVIQMELGQITPPVAMIIFTIKSMFPDVPMGTIFRGVLPFVAILTVVIILIIAFPQIALWLPSRM